MFHNFPYTDFHELNLDWLLSEFKNLKDKVEKEIISVEEYYKEVMALLDGIKENVAALVDEYLKDNKNLVLSADLTSNDIDIEELYHFYFDDGRHTGESTYCVFQSMVRMADGNFVMFSNDERDESEVGMIRVYSPAGQLIRSGMVTVGHAQDATTDGQNTLYIAHSIDLQGNRVGRVSIVDYGTLTLREVKTLPYNVNSIAYDTDKDQIITKEDNLVKIYNKEMTTVIRDVTIPEEFSTKYRSTKFPSLARQGTCYYNGMLGCLYSYPNALVFYDLETGDLVKFYNPPYTIGLAGIFDEIEDICYYDGKFYLTAFFITSDARYCGNVIGVFDPWENVQTQWAKYARYIVPKNIYIDGNATGPLCDGSTYRPYKNLTQAIAALKSHIGAETPINIYCKDGTNVGCLRATQLPNVNIDVYDDTGAGNGDYYTIEGVRVIECQQVYINHARIITNSDLNSPVISDNANSVPACYFSRVANGVMNACQVITAGYSIDAELKTQLSLRACELDHGATLAAIRAGGQSVVDYNQATEEQMIADRLTPFDQLYATVINADHYRPVNAIYQDEMTQFAHYILRNVSITSAASYDLFQRTVLATAARKKLHYVVLDVGPVDGTTALEHMEPIRVPLDIDTTIHFSFACPTGSNTVGVVAGHMNVGNNQLVITQLPADVHIFSVYAF